MGRRMKTRFIQFLVPALVFLTACAQLPEFDNKGVNTQLTPEKATQSPEKSIAQTIIWGGMILSIKNLKDSTQIEVLSYPLNDNQQPRPDDAPQGRFIVITPGYLESADYAPGRFISVRGSIQGIQNNRLGESSYSYPKVKSDKLYLWSKNFQAEQPRIHFGFGVIIGG